MVVIFPLTLLSVLAALVPPSACAAGAAGAALTLMDETTKKTRRLLVSLHINLVGTGKGFSQQKPKQ